MRLCCLWLSNEFLFSNQKLFVDVKVKHLPLHHDNNMNNLQVQLGKFTFHTTHQLQITSCCL